jgi:hypothetical protein
MQGHGQDPSQGQNVRGQPLEVWDAVPQKTVDSSRPIFLSLTLSYRLLAQLHGEPRLHLSKLCKGTSF